MRRAAASVTVDDVFHVLKSTYLFPAEVIEKVRPAHKEYLQGELDAGRIVLAGPLDDFSGGVLITGDITAEQADEIVARDPYTLEGVARYERSSFNPTFRASGV